jgi:alpha-beta hydrolase superfamily lysophospholipase
MVEVLRTTEPGHIDEMERESIRLYEYEQAMPTRETARIVVPGGEVHLDVYPASTDAPFKGTLTFVGGLSAHALQYATFLWRMSTRGWNVVALDVRGHGRSSGRRGDFTMEGLLDDVRGAIAYARQRFDYGGPMAFMGSSLGGYYSLVAANALEEIDIAVSHWIFDPNKAVTKKDARMRPVALVLNKIAPGIRLGTRGVANWDAVNESAEKRQRMYEDPLMTWRYSVRALAAGMTWAPSRPLNELRVPHLVVIGEEDQMTPAAYTREVFDWLVGDKTMRTIPHAGHMGGLSEHQEEMLDVVDGWLGERVPQLALAAPDAVATAD